jgi:hypothetical protein
VIEVVGDLWERYDAGAWACITTNGDVNTRWQAIMGRGVALQAKQRLPALPRVLGQKLLEQGNAVYWFPEWRLFTFPTKHSWRDRNSDIQLIANSVLQLAAVLRGLEVVGYDLREIVLPRPGCGAGGLRWADVQPFCAQLPDYVHVICPPHEAFGGA